MKKKKPKPTVKKIQTLNGSYMVFENMPVPKIPKGVYINNSCQFYPKSTP
jgi:hypothetical protein